MASLEFEQEKLAFEQFYDNNVKLLESAKRAFIRMVVSSLKEADIGEVTKIEGRVKDKEECVQKFHRKYLSKLEADEQPYEIKDYLSDLIGVRVICLYEDQIEAVSEALKRNFRVIGVTDKISTLENSEDSFGY